MHIAIIQVQMASSVLGRFNVIHKPSAALENLFNFGRLTAAIAGSSVARHEADSDFHFRDDDLDDDDRLRQSNRAHVAPGRHVRARVGAIASCFYEDF